MQTKFKLIPLGAALLALGGCAHYRQSLADYKKNEPTPYLQSTMAWVNGQGGASREDKATTRTAAAAPVVQGKLAQTTRTSELAALRAEFGETDEALTKVVAKVFALSPEEAARRMAPLREEQAMNERLSKRVNWDELRMAVALHNPAVRAGRQSWQAALRQFEQADYLESLIGQYRTFTRNLNVEPGNQMNRQMAQNFFPSPSVIALKGEMVRWMARMANEEWQMTLRDQAVEAGQAFYEYQYLTRAIAVSRENIELAKDLLLVVEESYRAGSGSQANVVKLQTALARQENELRDMESMRAGQTAKINASLGRKANAPLGAPDDKDYPSLAIKLEPLVERALRQRQEIQMQQAKVERTKVAIRMSEVMNRPLASQGYSLLERGMMAEAAPEPGGMEAQPQGGEMGGDSGAQQSGSKAKGGMGGGGSGRSSSEANSAPMGGAQEESNPSFGLRAKSVPRPLYAQAESYLAEMRQRLGAEQAQLEQVIAQTRGQARMMLEELDVARREVELVRGEILPKSEFTYNTSRSAYTAGQATFLDTLDAERMLLETRMELQKARRDLNKAALNLAMTAGEFLK